MIEGRVVITGGRGLLGTDLQIVLSERYTCIAPGKEELNVTDYDQVDYFLYGSGVFTGAVIHAAAYTNVDGCEKDPDLAYQVNALGTFNIAKACARRGIPLYIISTDYVFDGKNPAGYDEWSQPNPISTYGKTKWAGEQLARQACPGCIILRVQWLFGNGRPCFAHRIIKAAREGKQLGVLTRQVGKPTYTKDVARKICELLDPYDQRPRLPIYHLVNSGEVSRHELATQVANLAGGYVELVCLGESAIRPQNCSLQTRALQMGGYAPMRPWQEAFQEFLKEIG
jgi:dTDP-4-dehydrorhamnose reductase